MFGLIIAAACGLALVIGYFFNIYAVLMITALVCGLFIYEGSQPSYGTSGKLGGMIIGFIVFAPFVGLMLLTSIIVNWALLMSFLAAIAHYVGLIVLR